MQRWGAQEVYTAVISPSQSVLSCLILHFSTQDWMWDNQKAAKYSSWSRGDCDMTTELIIDRTMDCFHVRGSTTHACLTICLSGMRSLDLQPYLTSVSNTQHKMERSKVICILINFCLMYESMHIEYILAHATIIKLRLNHKLHVHHQQTAATKYPLEWSQPHSQAAVQLLNFHTKLCYIPLL